jgi:hypothetical protein
MASKKSTIPPQAQIPVAIGLAVLFALILAWRFFPADKEEEAAAIPAILPTGTEAHVSLADLTETLEALQGEHAMGLPRPGELPPLARNPFFLAGAGAGPAAGKAGASAYGDGDSVARQLALAARDRMLGSLVLSATCVAGTSSRAIINGRHVSIGDEVAGLIVQRIGERQVVLADDLGAHVMEIQKPAGLLEEAEQVDLTPAHKETDS